MLTNDRRNGTPGGRRNRSTPLAPPLSAENPTNPKSLLLAFPAAVEAIGHAGELPYHHLVLLASLNRLVLISSSVSLGGGRAGLSKFLAAAFFFTAHHRRVFVELNLRSWFFFACMPCLRVLSTFVFFLGSASEPGHRLSAAACRSPYAITRPAKLVVSRASPSWLRRPSASW